MTPEEQRDRLLEAITDWSRRFEHQMPDDDELVLLEAWFDICLEVEDEG